MRFVKTSFVALASALLLSGCFFWRGDEEEPRQRTVLFSGGEEIDADPIDGVCTWEGRPYRARTRVCEDGTFRECLEDGRWRVTGTC